MRDRTAENKKRRRRLALCRHMKGNECEICKYKKEPKVLEFHHVDPSEKEFTVNIGSMNRKIESIKEEVCECVLLCPTCHKETHMGLHPRYLK